MGLKDYVVRTFFSGYIANEAYGIANDAMAKVKAQLGFGGSYSSGAKYDGGLDSSGQSVNLSSFETRQKARVACHRSTSAKSVVVRFADTVSGTGLKLEATPKAELLGMTPEQAEKWSQLVELGFDSFANSKDQHRSGTMNFYQSHHLYQIFQHRDNDIFVRLYYSKDKSLQSRLQFEFLDPNQIRGDEIVSSYGFQGGDDGIVRNKSGRETGYKVWVVKNNENSEYKAVTIPAQDKSGRTLMLHGFKGEYAGQRRGVSRLAHALQELSDILDFQQSHIQKAITESIIGMYVKPSENAPASDPYESLKNNSGVQPVKTPSSTTEATTEIRKAMFDQLPHGLFTKPGGHFMANLEAGEDLKTVDGNAPSDSYHTFVDAVISHLSASMGIPIEVLLMKFNSNYSASRGALLMFWQVAEIWRTEMATDFLNPIYEMWLSEEIAAGRIYAPGFSDPRLRAAYLDCTWIGVPMPNIDPLKTAKATESHVSMGLTTLDRESRNLNGSSGAANRAKLRREFEELPESPLIKAKQGNTK